MGKLKWTQENIRLGVNMFFEEFNRYPTAEDFDNSKYLPSARQIQRAFGGLVNLRKLLKLDIIDYGSGDSRSKQSSEIGERGKEAERIMESILINHFGEHFVHVEKPLYKYVKDLELYNGAGKARSDFFVYHSGGVFCVDVFVARNMFTLKRIINIKAQNYQGLSLDVFLVLADGGVPCQISNFEIIKYCKNKTKQLDRNVVAVDSESFIKYIKTLKPLKVKK